VAAGYIYFPFQDNDENHQYSFSPFLISINLMFLLIECRKGQLINLLEVEECGNGLDNKKIIEDTLS